MKRVYLSGLMFIFGAVCALGLVAASDTWYEYRVIPGLPPALTDATHEGWSPYRVEHVGSSVVNYLRRPRLLPHAADTDPPAAAAPTTTPAIHTKTAKLAQEMRWLVQYSTGNTSDQGMRKLYYADSQTAYSELAAEANLDNTSSADAVRGILPSIKSALDNARAGYNNDDLIRLAVQLDHI